MANERKRNPLVYVMIPVSFVVIIGAMLIYGGFFAPDEEPPVEDNVPVEGVTEGVSGGESGGGDGEQPAQDSDESSDEQSGSGETSSGSQ